MTNKIPIILHLLLLRSTIHSDSCQSHIILWCCSSSSLVWVKLRFHLTLAAKPNRLETSSTLWLEPMTPQNGDVKISAHEVRKIANFLQLTEDEFIQQHTRLDTNRKGLSILENQDHSCSMLVNGSCIINPVKPEQCKGFPNTWNFPGWRKICHAKPVPIKEAQERGLL